MANQLAGGALFSSCRSESGDTRSPWSDAACEANLPQLSEVKENHPRQEERSEIPVDIYCMNPSVKSRSTSTRDDSRGKAAASDTNEDDGFCMIETSSEIYTDSSNASDNTANQVETQGDEHIDHDINSCSQPLPSTSANHSSNHNESTTFDGFELLRRLENEVFQKPGSLKKDQADREVLALKDDMEKLISRIDRMDFCVVKVSDLENFMKMNDNKVTLIRQDVEILRNELRIQEFSKTHYDNRLADLKQEIDRLRLALHKQHEPESGGQNNDNEAFQDRGADFAHYSRRPGGCRLVGHIARRAARAARYAAARASSFDAPMQASNSRGERQSNLDLADSPNSFSTSQVENMISMGSEQLAAKINQMLRRNAQRINPAANEQDNCPFNWNSESSLD